MGFLDWHPSFELGHPVLDADHRLLAASINHLVDVSFGTAAPMECRGDRHPRITAAVVALRQTVSDHFRDEEALMRMAGYPALAAHQRQHEELIAEFDRFAAYFRSPEDEIASQVTAFLRDWFSTHIRMWDEPLVLWLANRPEE